MAALLIIVLGLCFILIYSYTAWLVHTSSLESDEQTSGRSRKDKKKKE